MSGGAAAFESIYRWLFKCLRERGGFVHNESLKFLDIYRKVRNACLHNNTIYHHRQGPAGDADIVWHGTTYEFRHGRKLEFADDAVFVLLLIRELIDLAASIMRSPTVQSLPPII